MAMKKKNNKKAIIGWSVLAVLVVAGLIFFIRGNDSRFPENLDEFRNLVSCIDEEGECNSEAPNYMACDVNSEELFGVELPLFFEGGTILDCNGIILAMQQEGSVEEFLILDGQTIFKTTSVGEDPMFFTCDEKTKIGIVIEGEFNFNRFISWINKGKPWECVDKIPSFSIVG